ncbi:MAG: hypothetical protein FMNOHCHN_02053 [Ignavibacteriaceae bacterium]|nr:hypothetical protein [Ignavibacteriaceae bacterium]
MTTSRPNKLLEIDSISEFGAEKFQITAEPVIGLQRWTDKQYMLSFFPTDIEGNRLQYQSGIDKVYDLFLTEEQVESIVREFFKNKGIETKQEDREKHSYF